MPPPKKRNYWKRKSAEWDTPLRVISVGPPEIVSTTTAALEEGGIPGTSSPTPAVATSRNFCSNQVFTTKYNAFTFLPKFLMEQFSKYTNFFFLFIATMQQIPGVSPTNKHATWTGLTIVMTMSAIKELIEDFRRRSSDIAANNARALIYDNSMERFVRKKWADLHVGDLIYLTRGQQIPSDIVALKTSEPGGLCFVETANIDGETNLKIRQAPERLHSHFEPQGWRASLECEHPNDKIYSFEGKLTVHGERIGEESMEIIGDDVIPLGPEQLLLRGALLRNTEWIIGVVVYTGSDTKIMQNSKPRGFKMTKMERDCNRQLVWVFVILIASCLISTVASIYWEWTFFAKRHWYIQYPVLQKSQGSSIWVVLDQIWLLFKRFFTFVLLFHNLVPLNLLMSMEYVRYKLAQLIGSDMQIYDEESDTPTVCKSSTIIEELGQVEYILSDKTGTLTCNQMQLKSFVAGQQIYKNYLHRTDEGELDFTDGAAQVDFKKAMSLCHTVIIETILPPSSSSDSLPPPGPTSSNTYSYQASSPDELAIVEASRDLGYCFSERTLDTISLRLPDNQQEKYKVLAVIEFTSTRKRMSVLLEVQESPDYPVGQRILLCKGADSVIFERLDRQRLYLENITTALEDFASEGMRTLCFASRLVDHTESDNWLVQWHEALATVNNRQAALDTVSEVIERDLHLLGATAVEDKLQDGVPETIALLREAGIKMWVLTGDRKETAINIGFSCRLLSESMKIVRLDALTVEDVGKELQEAEKMVEYSRVQGIPSALIIEGRTLGILLEHHRIQFAKLSLQCQAVLCCRCSPLQKAQITDLVKMSGQEKSSDNGRNVKKNNRNYKICLAIGDGANDVGMIQSAQIGVGISGREGLQAAQAADFSIAQFRFLQRLLLVHGSWSYHRMSKVVQFCLYKNLTLYLGQAVFVALNGFSGQSLYDTWMLSFYNIFFTFFPIVLVGINEQYVSADKLLAHPKLYLLGLQSRFFNTSTFWTNIANSLFQAVLTVSLVIFILGSQVFSSFGFPNSHWFQGACVFACLLNVVTHKTFLIGNYWTPLVIVTTYASLFSWFVYTSLFDVITQTSGWHADISGLSTALYTSPTFWVLFIVVPVLALTRDVVWRFLQRWWYRPASYHIVQELQRLERKGQILKGEVPEAVKTLPPIVLPAAKERGRGFSFSQTVGQTKILKAIVPKQPTSPGVDIQSSSTTPSQS